MKLKVYLLGFAVGLFGATLVGIGVFLAWAAAIAWADVNGYNEGLGVATLGISGIVITIIGVQCLLGVIKTAVSRRNR